MDWPLSPTRPMTSTPFLSILGLGVVAGMRSMTAPAALAHVLAGRTLAPRDQPARFLSSDRVARITALAAAGEYVGDKLPMTPDRTDAFPLFGRIGSGALVGAGVASARDENVVVGALVGVAGALIGSFGGVWIRKALPGTLGLPDWPVALAEDALALSVGLASARAAVA